MVSVSSCRLFPHILFYFFEANYYYFLFNSFLFRAVWDGPPSRRRDSRLRSPRPTCGDGQFTALCGISKGQTGEEKALAASRPKCGDGRNHVGPFEKIGRPRLIHASGFSSPPSCLQGCRGVWDPPAVMGQRQGDSLDKQPVHHGASQKDRQPFALTQTPTSKAVFPIHLICMFLENQQRTHADKGEQANSTQKDCRPGIQLATFLTLQI